MNRSEVLNISMFSGDSSNNAREREVNLIRRDIAEHLLDWINSPETFIEPRASFEAPVTSASSKLIPQKLAELDASYPDLIDYDAELLQLREIFSGADGDLTPDQLADLRAGAKVITLHRLMNLFPAIARLNYEMRNGKISGNDAWKVTGFLIEKVLSWVANNGVRREIRVGGSEESVPVETYIRGSGVRGVNPQAKISPAEMSQMLRGVEGYMSRYN